MKRAVALLTVLLALGVTFECGTPLLAAPAHSSITLNLVAYSTPKAAYSALTAAFAKTKAGNGVTFNASYGPSGDQSRAVLNGLPADIVAFSLAPDVDRLVQGKLVSSSWNKNAYHGSVDDSVVVFVVRKGNPKHIKTWNDLIKPGVQVLTPNPFSSGGARWNIMAAYGAQIAAHKTQRQALSYLGKLFDHVVVQDKSASDELQTFLTGKGDVMLDYESNAITARRAGNKLDYIIPKGTILIENPVAVTTSTKYPKQANAFVKFLYSSAGQKIFAQQGYRPVVSSVFKKFHFPTPKSLFSIRKFGGWNVVDASFFDPEKGYVAEIERSHGVSP